MPKKVKVERDNYLQSVRGLRFLVRGYYDVQAARQVAKSRTMPAATEDDVDQDVTLFLDNQFALLQKRESDISAQIKRFVESMPVYREVFAKKYHGLGHMAAAVILSECDIERQDTPSKMWAFAGLNTVPCERCASCGWEVSGGRHRVKTTCTDTRIVEGRRAPREADGKNVRKDGKVGLPYNKDLRVRLLGVLAGNLIKAGTGYVCEECAAPVSKAGAHKGEENECQSVAPVKTATSPWRKVYDDYRHRKESQGWGCNAKHVDFAAKRYMVKQLLREVWVDWRAFMGLPVREPYHVEKLGMLPHSKAA